VVVFIFQLSRSVLYSNKMCFVLLWQFCGRRSVTQLATLELVVDYFSFIFLSNIFSKNTSFIYYFKLKEYCSKSSELRKIGSTSSIELG
jgi:hypothetical protein